MLKITISLPDLTDNAAFAFEVFEAETLDVFSVASCTHLREQELLARCAVSGLKHLVALSRKLSEICSPVEQAALVPRRSASATPQSTTRTATQNRPTSGNRLRVAVCGLPVNGPRGAALH